MPVSASEKEPHDGAVMWLWEQTIKDWDGALAVEKRRSKGFS
jgi:hypothetical protein